MGAEIAWPKPVRPGAVLRVVSAIQDITRSRSKPWQGIVTVTSETLDESGTVVQRMVSRLMVAGRRDPAGDADGVTPA
jgi:acyl dehydratase